MGVGRFHGWVGRQAGGWVGGWGWGGPQGLCPCRAAWIMGERDACPQTRIHATMTHLQHPWVARVCHCRLNRPPKQAIRVAHKVLRRVAWVRGRGGWVGGLCASGGRSVREVCAWDVCGGGRRRGGRSPGRCTPHAPPCAGPSCACAPTRAPGQAGHPTQRRWTPRPARAAPRAPPAATARPQTPGSPGAGWRPAPPHPPPVPARWWRPPPAAPPPRTARPRSHAAQRHWRGGEGRGWRVGVHVCVVCVRGGAEARRLGQRA